MGVILCLVISSIKNKYRNLSKNGEKTEGTLVDYEISSVKNTNLKFPVVRFITKNEQQIIKKTENSFYSTTAKKGSRVIVFYNPSNPEEFMIQGKNFKLMYGIVMAGGILFSLSGVILILNYTGVLKLFK